MGEQTSVPADSVKGKSFQMNLSSPAVSRMHTRRCLSGALCYGSKAAMTQDNRPVYLRLRDIIAAAIIDGTYAEGAMLPSVRAFAAEQGANPLTVAKAYQQFQLDGLVEVQRGVGMFVASGAAEKLRRSGRESFL